MATVSLIPVEEYLKTTSEPDHEFGRGVLEKRAMPDWDHSEWQSALIGWFRDHQHEWDIRVFPQLRVRIAPDEFRTPDVTLLSRQAPREPFLTHAPLAVFEILSPDDTMSGIMDKLEAYDKMGIPAIWVIDPRKPVYRRYSRGKLIEAQVFELPGTDFSVPISEIAATAD
jgi:Uma2 family endonuclease